MVIIISSQYILHLLCEVRGKINARGVKAGMGDVSECLDYCRRVFGDLPGGWYRLQIEATEARFLEMSTGMATDFEPAVYPFFRASWQF
jgi:hypothetical protein